MKILHALLMADNMISTSFSGEKMENFAFAV